MENEPIIPGPAQGIFPYPKNGNAYEIDQIRKKAPPYGPGHTLQAAYNTKTSVLLVPAGTVLYTCHAVDVAFSPERGAFYGSNPIVALCGSKRIRDPAELKRTAMYAIKFTQETAIQKVAFKAKPGGDVNEMNLGSGRMHIAPYIPESDGYSSSVSDPQAVEVAIKLLPKHNVAIHKCALFTDPAIYMWVASANAEYLDNYSYKGKVKVKHIWPLIAMKMQRNRDHTISGTYFSQTTMADNTPQELEMTVRIYPYLALEEFYQDRDRHHASLFTPYRQIAELIVTISDRKKFPKEWWEQATDAQARTALKSLKDYKEVINLSKISKGVLTTDDLARAAAITKCDIIPPKDIAEQWYSWPPRHHQSIQNIVEYRIKNKLSVPIEDFKHAVHSIKKKKIRQRFLMSEFITPDQRTLLIESLEERDKPDGYEWADAIKDNNWSLASQTALLEWLCKTNPSTYEDTIDDLGETGYVPQRDIGIRYDTELAAFTDLVFIN